MGIRPHADRDWYDTAQVCMNGHVITGEAVAHREKKLLFCKTCGAKTIEACPKCGTSIQGHYQERQVISYYPRELPTPKYCGGCGRAFPWTAAALKATRELTATLDKLNAKERAQLNRDLLDLTKETPRATVAAEQFKVLVRKAGKQAPGAFKDLLVGVVSDVILKQMGLG